MQAHTLILTVTNGSDLEKLNSKYIEYGIKPVVPAEKIRPDCYEWNWFSDFNYYQPIID